MSTGRDDDALNWNGDDDPTLDARANSTPPRAPKRNGRDLPPGYTAVGRGSGRRRTDHAPDPETEPTALSNAALIGIGAVGAAFVLFAVGWLFVSFRLQAVEGLPVPAVALVTISLAAAAAPLIWFAAAYLLTRRSKTWVRFAWLLAGVVLLVPWPFLATGGLG